MRTVHITRALTGAAMAVATILVVTGREAPMPVATVDVVDLHRPALVAAPNPPGSRVAAVMPADPIAGEGSSRTRREQELLEWAVERFSLVGLTLPPVDVSFHDRTEPCGGHRGRFQGDRTRRRVAVCVPDSGTSASRLQRRRTLIHELAHAWDHANLDPRRRADLLPVLDATGWYAPEAEWEERGVERFAETLVWGLYDQLRRPTLIDVPCRELHTDFLAITGFAAPGPVEQTCQLRTPINFRTDGRGV